MKYVLTSLERVGEGLYQPTVRHGDEVLSETFSVKDGGPPGLLVMNPTSYRRYLFRGADPALTDAMLGPTMRNALGRSHLGEAVELPLELDDVADISRLRRERSE